MPVPQAAVGDPLPPQDGAAERRLLAGLMREPVLVGRACEFHGVGEGDLFHHSHRLVWRAARGLAACGFETGPAAVYMVMRASGDLAELPSPAALWLAEVWEEDPTGAWCDRSCGEVKRASVLRALAHRANEILRDVHSPNREPEFYAKLLAAVGT